MLLFAQCDGDKVYQLLFRSGLRNQAVHLALLKKITGFLEAQAGCRERVISRIMGMNVPESQQLQPNIKKQIGKLVQRSLMGEFEDEWGSQTKDKIRSALKIAPSEVSTTLPFYIKILQNHRFIFSMEAEEAML